MQTVLCRTGNVFRGYLHPEGMRLSFTGEAMLKGDINRTADERLDKSFRGAKIDAEARCLQQGFQRAGSADITRKVQTHKGAFKHSGRPCF